MGSELLLKRCLRTVGETVRRLKLCIATLLLHAISPPTPKIATAAKTEKKGIPLSRNTILCCCCCCAASAPDRAGLPSEGVGVTVPTTPTPPLGGDEEAVEGALAVLEGLEPTEREDVGEGDCEGLM